MSPQPSMIPFAEAVGTKYSHKLKDGTAVYNGVLNAFWTVAAVPHGGVVLGVIVNAVIKHQANSSQPDPIHISAHYMEPSTPNPCEIRIKIHRTGRRYSNITADLYQNGKINVTTHIIVGTLPDPGSLSKDQATPSILPPHPFATKIPLRTHSAVAKPTKKPAKLTFRDALEFSNDPVISERQKRKGDNPDENEGGFDDASWYQFLNAENKDIRVGLSAVAFLSDMGRNTPNILPKADRPGDSWHPTMSFQLEFKVKLSALPAYIAPQTFGVWSTGRFIHEGRHEVHTEVWTAPSDIGSTGSVRADDPKWRDKMFCIARSSQMALTIPLEVNKRKAKHQDNGEKAKL